MTRRSSSHYHKWRCQGGGGGGRAEEGWHVCGGGGEMEIEEKWTEVSEGGKRERMRRQDKLKRRAFLMTL